MKCSWSHLCNYMRVVEILMDEFGLAIFEFVYWETASSAKRSQQFVPFSWLTRERKKYYCNFVVVLRKNGVKKLLDVRKVNQYFWKLLLLENRWKPFSIASFELWELSSLGPVETRKRWFCRISFHMLTASDWDFDVRNQTSSLKKAWVLSKTVQSMPWQHFICSLGKTVEIFQENCVSRWILRVHSSQLLVASWSF